MLKGISQQNDFFAFKHLIYHVTTVTLQTTGFRYKFDKNIRRQLVREAAMRPLATINELLEFLESTGCVAQVTTLCCLILTSGLWGRVAKKKPFLRKNIEAQKHTM